MSHFSCCDYSISRADPRNVATSKISLLRQEWTSLSFSVTTVAKRSFFKMTGFLDLFFWTVKSLFRGMSRKASWCLLKKITKHATQACSTYVYLKKLLRKLEKNLRRGLFYEIVGLQITVYLKWMSTQTIARNLRKVLVATLKDNEGKYAFEKIAIELYKQPKTKIRK